MCFEYMNLFLFPYSFPELVVAKAEKKNPQDNEICKNIECLPYQETELKRSWT